MSEESAPIRGKVARVLNSREIALNIGEANGVRKGMIFEVLDPKGEDILDPDTQEVLGSLPRVKVRVKVERLQERLSVAKTYRKRRVNVGGTGPDFSVGLEGLASSLLPPKWVTRYETLKTREASWEDLSEEESYVKIGDPVAQVLEDQNDDSLG